MSNDDPIGKEPAEGVGLLQGWTLPALAVALALCVLWMGQVAASHLWFFLGPWSASMSVKFVLLVVLLSSLFLWGGERICRWTPGMLVAMSLGGQSVIAWSAWGALGGAAPWGFDHPSFMYRLKEFGAIFPSALGSYNPFWNAGTEHFEGVTSGAHSFGLLLLPLLKIWDPHLFYGAALIFWFVFAFPWLGVASVRSAGVGLNGALCAGLLMCGVSREEFLWMWHFGTVGASASAMVSLPVVALAYRLAVLRRGSWGTALALAVLVWLMCLWTPGVSIGLGLALGWLLNYRSWSWRVNRWLVVAGALALFLLLPWFWTTLFPCRNVVQYVGMAMEHPGCGTMALSGAHRLLRELQEWHPVLTIFGLLGTLLAVPRTMRRWMLPVFVVLGAIAGWSREIKPLSQLDRMALPMAVVAVFPAAALCGRLFGDDPEPDSASRRQVWFRALGQGIVLATLVMGFRVVRIHYANGGPAPLRTLSSEMTDWVEWIRAEVPEEGRLGFAGRTVHFYGGGNIAYLPVLTGREMMADDYYGFPRGTIEFNYPPGTYRKEIESYMFFSRAYGITHWVASMQESRDFLRAHPDCFERVRSMMILEREIDVYRVKDIGTVSRFWEGAGRVSARENQLEVFPEDPSAARVVIRYNWRDGLFCRTPGASITPLAVDDNLRFIAVQPGGNARVEIGYRPHMATIKPNFDGHFHH